MSVDNQISRRETNKLNAKRSQKPVQYQAEKRGLMTVGRRYNDVCQYPQIVRGVQLRCVISVFRLRLHTRRRLVYSHSRVHALEGITKTW